MSRAFKKGWKYFRKECGREHADGVDSMSKDRRLEKHEGKLSDVFCGMTTGFPAPFREGDYQINSRSLDVLHQMEVGIPVG